MLTHVQEKEIMSKKEYILNKQQHGGVGGQKKKNDKVTALLPTPL